MKNNSSDLHYSAKARMHEGANVETHGVRLNARRHESTNVEAKGFRLKAILWRMRNVLKGLLREIGKKAGNKTRMEQSTDQ
jgi:hypothetical protein